MTSYYFQRCKKVLAAFVINYLFYDKTYIFTYIIHNKYIVHLIKNKKAERMYMMDVSKPYRARNMLVNKLEVENENGVLDIGVFSEENLEPISDATVTIYLYKKRGIYREAATESSLGTYYTDANGKIPIIQLPVIHELEKENTDEYHVKVEKEGFYPVIIMNIEIFPNLTTNYSVGLNPVVTEETHTEFIIIPEKHQ